MPSKKNLQVALEFMIIFSFVLIVFTVLFSVISAQRAQTASSQVYSQEQLIAQNIAAQLDRALQAGGGYFAKVPLSGLVGSLTYQISITKNGAVIVNASVGTEVLRAIAYSTVKDVVSDPTFSQNGALPYYNLPVTNGTMVIQNSFGTICVDYQCPSTLGQARNLSLYSQSTHAANFNGQNSYISMGNVLNFGSTNSFTVTAWMYLTTKTGYNRYYAISKGLSDSGSGYPAWDVGFYTNNAFFSIADASTEYRVGYDGPPITYNKWYFAVFKVNRTSQFATAYLNNIQIGSAVSISSLGSLSNSAPFTIGQGSYQNGYGAFNGFISNVQVYNIPLSANDMQALYQAGIAAGPVRPQNLIGWWPLGGNSNDYSGGGNNGNAIGPVLYTSVSQLSAKVTDQFGRPVKNSIVGFSTNLGNFTNSHFTTNYTNSNGIATAFLNQKGVNGQAFVTAAAYNGNLSFQSSLIGWWPLSQNLTQGQTIYDMSGNANNGIIINYAPNLAAQFDALSSYIAATAPSINTAGGGYNTVSFWMYWNGWSYGTNQGIFSFAGNYILRLYAPSYNPGLGRFGCLGFATLQGDEFGIPVSTTFNNNWVHITAEFYNGQESGDKIYVNGVPQSPSLCAGSSYSASASTSYQISGAPGLGGYIFSGQLSNVQVYNTGLSDLQAKQLYDEGISGQPLGSGLVSWYPLSGNSLDMSGNANTGAVYGNLNYVPVAQPQNPNINNNFLVANFNGVGSYMSLGNSISLSPQAGANGQMTYCMWYYINTLAGYSGPAFKGPGSPSSGNALEYSLDYNGLSQGFGVWAPNGGVVASGSLATPLTAGSWDFPCFTYNYTSQKAYYYLNGVQYPASITTSNGPAGTGTGSLVIGAGGAGYSKIRAANIQLYNVSLSPAEISKLYLAGIGGLPTHVQSLVGWWPLNGNLNDYSGKAGAGIGNNVVYVQQQSLQTANASLNGYGINFNKTYDYVTANVPQVSTAVGGYNTASFWMYWNGNANGMPLAFTDGHNIKQSLWFASQGCFGFSIGNADAYGMNPSQLLSRWVFVTAEFYNGYNGYSKLYINGVLQPLSQCAGNPSGGSANSHIYIGGIPLNGGYYFNGTMADFRLYSGALSSQQVLNLYLSQTAPKASASAGMSWIP